jgi:hypothetical protein
MGHGTPCPASVRLAVVSKSKISIYNSLIAVVCDMKNQMQAKAFKGTILPLRF